MAFGDTAFSAGVATVVATAITSLTGVAIARSARRAESGNTIVTARSEVEKEAFARAEKFYLNAMQRQDDTIAAQGLTIAKQGEKLERQERDIERQDRELAACGRREQRLREELEELREQLGELGRKLGTAEAALRERRGER